MTARRRDHRLVGPALVAAVLILGLSGTWALAATVARNHQQYLGELMDGRMQTVDIAVTTQIGRYTDTLGDLAVAVGAQNDLSAADFASLTSSVTRARLPGASGVALVVPGTTAQVPQVQRHWRVAGNRGLTLAPEPGRDEHFFIVLNAPLDGGKPLAGWDVAALTEPATALRRSRSGSLVAASPTYVLMRDRFLPKDEQQLSFVLAAAVRGGLGTSDAGQFRGWVMMGLRGGDFITETLGAAAQDEVAVTLLDASTSSSERKVVANNGERPLPEQPQLRREQSVDVGGRHWQLVIEPVRADDSGTSQTGIAAGVGSAFTLLLASLVATLSRSRGRALRQVGRATTELRADIARREQVEQRLRERESELEAFAGIVAHDLKAPLNTVAGYCTVLSAEHGPHLDAEANGYLHRITRSTERMRGLIDDLLSYAAARDIVLDQQWIDLRELVQEVLADHAGHRGVTPTPQIQLGSLPVVHADPVLLRQVMANLMANAIKYCRPGTVPDIAVSAEVEPGSWRIEIRDHGIGIAPDDQLSIFEAFRRAPNSEGYIGTGLGLAICKRVVERHEGQIGVLSALGRAAASGSPCPPPSLVLQPSTL